jgi:hypothetical protein
MIPSSLKNRLSMILPKKGTLVNRAMKNRNGNPFLRIPTSRADQLILSHILRVPPQYKLVHFQYEQVLSVDFSALRTHFHDHRGVSNCDETGFQFLCTAIQRALLPGCNPEFHHSAGAGIHSRILIW